jgi:hypothetical protein
VYGSRRRWSRRCRGWRAGHGGLCRVPRHGAPTEAHLLRHGVQRPPRLLRRPALVIMGPPSGAPRAGQACRRRGRLWRGERDRGGRGSCRRPGRLVHRRRRTGLLGSEARSLGGVCPADGGQHVRELLQHMNPLRHVARRGRPEAGRFRVRLGPVPDQDLAPRRRLKPRGDSRDFPVGQQGQRPPPCQVHQEGARGMTPSQGDLLDAEDPWGGHHGAGGAPDHPSEGVPADEEASRLAQPHPRRPPEREAEGEDAWRQSSGAPGPGRHPAGPSRGEEAAWALPRGAEPLADATRPRHPGATPREISQRPGIMPVDRPGRAITARAAGFRWGGREQAGELGVPFVEVPGVQVARGRVGSSMGQRVLTRHGSSGVSSAVSSSIRRHPGRRGERPHHNWPRT